MKSKICKAESCNNTFTPRAMGHVACSPRCALDIAKAKKIKKHAQETNAMRRQMLSNDRRHQMKRAQSAFNDYIRERDKDLPCISCGRYHQGQYHAGHYRTVGSNPELRFSELNCHKQCAPCNNHKSGNIVEYRINLKMRIGPEKLAWLEGPHEAQKYTIDDLKEIARLYRHKLKVLRQV